MGDVGQVVATGADGDGRTTELGGLIARCARGDRSAFAAVYDDTVATSFHLALVVLGDLEAAEKVTCAAYAEVWERAHEFDVDHRRASSWVTTIVYESARSARGARAA